MKLLMVEDNELNRKLLREVLSHKGHTAEEAVTAEEAIAALERMPAPDVVLLDIDIPGGGLTLACSQAGRFAAEERCPGRGQVALNRRLAPVRTRAKPRIQS